MNGIIELNEISDDGSKNGESIWVRVSSIVALKRHRYQVNSQMYTGSLIFTGAYNFYVAQSPAEVAALITASGE